MNLLRLNKFSAGSVSADKREKVKSAAQAVITAFSYKPSRNLLRELIRLLFEISLRDNISPGELAPGFEVKDKNTVLKYKKELLDRRFKNAGHTIAGGCAYLPEVSCDNSLILKPEDCIFNPSHIFFEEGAEKFSVYERVRNAYPDAEFTRIDKFKDYVRSAGSGVSTAEYNRRRDALFLIKERFDFYKKCPCTNNALRCGYFIFNLGFGCPYECSYCYLQHYQDHPGIVLCVNPEDYLERFDGFYEKFRRKGMRIGTGEFTDSLVFDGITEYSTTLVDFFRKKDTRFELKTKSANVDNLLKIQPASNIVVSWSLNPPGIIEKNEQLAATLQQRLEATQKCRDHGYSLAFHFDPIIIYDGWEDDYSALVDRLFSVIGDADIEWISLGTLRFNKALKTIAEKRFPDTDIFLGELLTGADLKMRYPRNVRLDAYKKMVGWIRKHNKSAWVYLCMEDKEMWANVYKKHK